MICINEVNVDSLILLPVSSTMQSCGFGDNSNITFPADSWAQVAEYAEEVVIIRQEENVPARFNDFNPR